MPLVSIITPCYNAQDFIARTIESVLNQTYQNWEMIIVDDLSIDKSLEILSKYALNESRVKIIKNDVNQGVGKSRNFAIHKAKGKYIAFLDSDDVWLSHKLEKQVKFMLKYAVTISYSSYLTIDENGISIGAFYVRDMINYENLLTTSSIGTLTLMYDAESIGKLIIYSKALEIILLPLCNT